MAESINPDDLTDEEFAAYEVSEIAGAGHLVLTLTKANDWTGAIDAIRKDQKLAQRVAHRLEELDFLIEELDDNTDLMAAQRKTPKVSVAICTVCNATASYASNALPDKCHMTIGCTGLWKKPANYTIKAKPDEGRVTTK